MNSLHSSAGEPDQLSKRVWQLCVDAREVLGPAYYPRFEVIEVAFSAPIRAALIGRVNSGKSTLVNALVGQLVAPTNATECTRVTTLYRNGLPARAVVVGHDGREITLPISEQLPESLGRPAVEISHVVVYLPNRVLRSLELIDTPGTAGLGGNAAPESKFLTGPLGPDVIFLLFDSSPPQADLETLAALGATRSNTIALLSHADNFGSGAAGATDAIETAKEFADKLATQFAQTFAHVVAVSGLLGEAALTGKFREQDARVLARFAGLDEFEVELKLADLDENVDELLEKIGLYGIMHARDLAPQGAHAVTAWLLERSGVGSFVSSAQPLIARRVGIRRARRVIDDLNAMSRQSPQQRTIEALISEAEMDPALHPLRELRALDLIMRWSPTHNLVTELDRHMSESATQLLNVPVGSSPAAIRAAALQRCGQAKTRKLTARSAAEIEALTVLERSYQIMAMRQN